MWNRILVLLKSQMIYASSDEESDGDKDYKKTHIIHMRSWKNNYYTMTHYLLNFDSGTKLT